MKILITGFEPFGESPINPSQILVDRLPNTMEGGIEICKAILPVDKQAGPETLLKALVRHEPNAVLCFGLAMGRPMISLERVALNLMDYRIPDNAGVSIQDQPIAPDGPAAYFSTLPLHRMLDALKDSGIPAELSLTAGAYLCNQVFYTLMHTLAIRQSSIPAGFIHLPALPEQAAASDKSIPSMNIDMMLRATEILITRIFLPLES